MYQFNFFTTPTSYVEIIKDGVSKATYSGGEIKPSQAGDYFMLADNRANNRASFAFSIKEVTDISVIEIDGVAQALPATISDFYETYKGYFFKASAPSGAGGSVLDLVYDAVTGDLTLTQDSGTSPIVANIPPQTVANLADTAFINTVNGNDATGQIGNLSKPYLTFAGALASGALFVESVTNVDNFVAPNAVNRDVTIITNSFTWSTAGFPMFNFSGVINVSFFSALANCDTGYGVPNYISSGGTPNIRLNGKFFNNNNGGSFAKLTARDLDCFAENYPAFNAFVDLELVDCDVNQVGDVPFLVECSNVDWEGGQVFEESTTVPGIAAITGGRVRIKHRTKSTGALKTKAVVGKEDGSMGLNTGLVLKGCSFDLSTVSGTVAAVDVQAGESVSFEDFNRINAPNATYAVSGVGTVRFKDTLSTSKPYDPALIVSGNGFYDNGDIRIWSGADVYSTGDKSFWKPFDAGSFWEFNFPADAGNNIGQFVKWQELQYNQDVFSNNGQTEVFQNDLKWQVRTEDYGSGAVSRFVVDPTDGGLDGVAESSRSLGFGYSTNLPLAGLNANAWVTKTHLSSQLDYNASSGLYTDGEGLLSVGTGGAGVATTFSISDGTGQVEMNGVVTPVTWSGLTDIAVTDIATQNITFVAINSVGAVVQQSTRWTDEFARGNIILGVVVHVNRVNVDTVNNEQEVINNASAQVGDVLEALGFFNVSGNVFSDFSTNLQIEKSVGVMAGRGIGFDTNGHKNPHTKTLPILNPITALQYRMQDGSSGSLTATVVDPTIWDDGSPYGSAPTVPTNRFTIQRIYSFTSNNVKIQPGQTIYNSLAAAKGAIQTEAFVTEPSIAANGMLRAFLIVKGDTTDLSDASKVLFLDAGKFGSSTGAGGAESGGGGIDPLNQVEYTTDNVTLQASDNGKVVVYNGSPVSGVGVLTIPSRAVLSDAFKCVVRNKTEDTLLPVQAANLVDGEPEFVCFENDTFTLIPDLATAAEWMTISRPRPPSAIWVYTEESGLTTNEILDPPTASTNATAEGYPTTDFNVTISFVEVNVTQFITNAAGFIDFSFRYLPADGSETTAFTATDGTLLGTVRIDLDNTSGLTRFYKASSGLVNLVVPKGQHVFCYVSGQSVTSATGAKVVAHTFVKSIIETV